MHDRIEKRIELKAPVARRAEAFRMDDNGWSIERHVAQ